VSQASRLRQDSLDQRAGELWARREHRFGEQREFDENGGAAPLAPV
jgi:hypothetical protein